jgi:hypothetical protein
MASTWLDDPALESAESVGDDYGEGELSGIDGELAESSGDPLDDAEASGLRTRRARARQIALARSRAARERSMRSGPPTTAAGAVRRTQAAVREVDLANRVQADAVSVALAKQGKRIRGTENAVAASAVVPPLLSALESFSSTSTFAANPVVKTGLPLMPLLLLRPARRHDGVQGLLADPRVWAVGAAAGLAIVKEIKGNANRVQILAEKVAAGSSATFSAVAFDRDGHRLPNVAPAWDSSSSNITIDNTGQVDARNATKGDLAVISAIVDGAVATVTVEVQ